MSEIYNMAYQRAWGFLAKGHSPDFMPVIDVPNIGVVSLNSPLAVDYIIEQFGSEL